jgi:hypothetical protein
MRLPHPVIIVLPRMAPADLINRLHQLSHVPPSAELPPIGAYEAGKFSDSVQTRLIAQHCQIITRRKIADES